MNFNIREKIRNGYSLDLGKLIEDCFEIYKKTFLIAGLGFLIVAITAIVLYAFLGATLIGVSSLSDWTIQMESMQHEVSFIIGNFVITILFSALMAPLNAGFLKLCLLAKRNQELNLGVIFEYYKSKFEEANLNPSQHIVIITDPGTPLDISARDQGFKVVNADPNVGGRFSALSAFGLVPAALIGVDISLLLDDAEKLSRSLSVKDSAAVVIAACLYSLTDQIINFCDKESPTPGLSNWIEQLIAESTGKDLTGRLPVVIEDAGIAISGITVGFAPGEYDLVIEGTLGEQFILWEWVTALLCYLLKVDPFNQPNVTEAKDRTSAILLSLKSKGFNTPTPTYEDSNYLIYSNQKINSISEFLKSNVAYFAVLAYLARGADDEISKIRKLIAAESKTATTFGWGPRYLHSTGQFHKGGQQNGGFIVITGELDSDIKIPNKDYTFSQLITAQALADIESLSERKLPLIRIHLKNRKKAIARLISDLEKN